MTTRSPRTSVQSGDELISFRSTSACESLHFDICYILGEGALLRVEFGGEAVGERGSTACREG